MKPLLPSGQASWRRCSVRFFAPGVHEAVSASGAESPLLRQSPRAWHSVPRRRACRVLLPPPMEPHRCRRLHELLGSPSRSGRLFLCRERHPAGKRELFNYSALKLVLQHQKQLQSADYTVVFCGAKEVKLKCSSYSSEGKPRPDSSTIKP